MHFRKCGDCENGASALCAKLDSRPQSSPTGKPMFAKILAAARRYRKPRPEALPMAFSILLVHERTGKT